MDNDTYDFSLTDEDLNDVENQAKKHIQDHAAKEKASAFEGRPVAPFLKAGSHLIRPYPDRDARGKARYSRKIYVHRQLPVAKDKNVWIWADDRVDSLLVQFQKDGMAKIFNDDLWKFKSQEQGIMCVHIFESSDKENHPAGMTCILILNSKQHTAWNTWLTTLHPEEMRVILNPLEDAPGIRINFDSGAKSNVSVGVSGLGMRKVHLPLPPRLWDSNWKNQLKENNDDVKAIKTYSFTSLDDYVRKETDRMTDEQFDGFQEMAYREFEAWKANNNNKVRDSSAGKGYRPDEGRKDEGQKSNDSLRPTSEIQRQGAKSEKLARELSGTGERNCPLSERIARKPELVNTFGHDVKFGNRPDGSNPDCLMCPHDFECRKLTKENREASLKAAA
jgi:hypothetical protein